MKNKTNEEKMLDMRTKRRISATCQRGVTGTYCASKANIWDEQLL